MIDLSGGLSGYAHSGGEADLPGPGGHLAVQFVGLAIVEVDSSPVAAQGRSSGLLDGLEAEGPARRSCPSAGPPPPARVNDDR